ncbi:MAG TPA: tetratricopeptide repeat protein, partial [Pyrinomonadaceae bacterium]|nr:tetratricopeptide repeat protein [Pyrinomonadaceae bacterium]
MARCSPRDMGEHLARSRIVRMEEKTVPSKHSSNRAIPRFLFVFWCVVFIATFEYAQAPTTLAPNSPVERELKGGQTDAYVISLLRDQFLHVVVDQNGIDVEVKLIKPDAQTLVTTDGPNGRFGPEEIAAISEAPGDYRLEVRSPSKTAPAGHYKISMDGLRSPTEIDRQRIAADSAFTEAYMKLRPQRTPAARKAAIEKCKDALKFFQSIGDQYRQAWIMHVILLMYADSGEFRKALDYGTQTLPLFQAVKDTLGESSTRNILGGMSDILGDPQGALRYYKEALALAQSSNNQSVVGSALNNIGKIYNDLADWQKSIEYYNQALVVFRALGNQRSEAITQHNIGVALIGLGETDRALDTLQQALVLRRTVGDKGGEADTLTSIGYVYNSRGMPEKALEFYNQALPLRVAAGDRRGEGVTLDQIGIAYAAQGQLKKALEYHQQALERHRAAQSPRTEAVALGNIGHVYNLLGESQKALDFDNQALSIFRNIGDRQNEAKMLADTAFAERSAGRLTEALQHLDEALNLIEAVRSTAGAQQSRSSYFASQHGTYELYVDLLMQLDRQSPSAGYDAKALQASERMRARTLMELLTEANVDIRQGTDPALVARERKLGQTLNAKAQRQIQLRAQKGSQEEIDTLDREVNSLETEYAQVQASIRKTSPAYAALTQPQPLTLQQIQKQLDPKTLLLEYSLGDDHSYLWTVSQTSLKSYELPGRQQIQETARRVYDLLTARSANKGDEAAVDKQSRIAEADRQLTAAAADLSKMV